MTGETEAAIARIDQRTLDMDKKLDVACSQVTINTNRLTVLETEHKNRTQQGADCSQAVNVPGVSKTVLAVFGAGNSVIVLIVILLLKKWGIL